MIGISDAFSDFLFTGIRHLPHVFTVPQTKACLLCATPTGMDLCIQVHARRHLPSAVPWISEDRLLRSASDTRTFVTPRVNTKTFGETERSSSYAGPSVWNNLPQTLRHFASTSSFKASLKTHLFNNYF